VQRCKSAYGLCKGGKVGPEYGVQITEYGVQSTEEPGHKKVGTWQDRVQSTECRVRRDGRGVASPRPPGVGVQGEALPLPAGGAREIGQHMVLSLPEAGDDAERRHKQLGQHAVLPLPDTK
jgi:hypothetical protein